MTLRMIANLVLVAGLATAPAGLAASKTKKLIEFGWDEPDTAFMREHAAEMEQSPFDGCVFHVEAKKCGANKGNFTWAAWGNRVFTEEELRPALAELKTAKFRRFTHHFLRFNTTLANLYWFDVLSA